VIEPLKPNQVKALILASVTSDEVVFTSHALRELANDGMGPSDALRVLRGGAASHGEFENGSWRYQVRAGSVVVVVRFVNFQPASTLVITAWKRSR
jgi:hypothetical protein